jgi:uncharacterized lipoprotein NlpE involved in copper resistance
MLYNKKKINLGGNEMKKIITIIFVILTLAGCGGSQVTTDEIKSKLSSANIPAESFVIYSADTDPNKFLGKEGQYIAKMDWIDSRHKGEDNYCTVEIFKNTDDMKARRAYIEAIEKRLPSMSEGVKIEYKTSLIRLNGTLTETESAQYIAALK